MFSENEICELFFNINTFFINKTKSTLIAYVALTKPDCTYTSLSYSHDKEFTFQEILHFQDNIAKVPIMQLFGC